MIMWVHRENYLLQSRHAFLVSFVNNVLFTWSVILLAFFVGDNNFIFFSWTWFIEFLNFFFRQFDLIVFTRGTSADRWTLAIYFLTSAVVVFTILRAITAILINFDSINYDVLFFKSFLINGLGLVNDKVSSFILVLRVKAISAFATRATVSQIFETRAVKSQTVGIFTFAALGILFSYLLFFLRFYW